MINEMYGIIYGNKDRKIQCLIFAVAVYVYVFSNISTFGMKLVLKSGKKCNNFFYIAPFKKEGDIDRQN